MNNQKAKALVSSLKGKSLLFKVNIGRNKSEKFEGEILNTYHLCLLSELMELLRVLLIVMFLLRMWCLRKFKCM